MCGQGAGKEPPPPPPSELVLASPQARMQGADTQGPPPPPPAPGFPASWSTEDIHYAFGGQGKVEDTQQKQKVLPREPEALGGRPP